MFKFAVATTGALSSTGANGIYLTKDSLRGSGKKSDFPVPWQLQKPLAELLTNAKEKLPGFDEVAKQIPQFAAVEQLLMSEIQPESREIFQKMLDNGVDQFFGSEEARKNLTRENLKQAEPFLEVFKQLKEPVNQWMAIFKEVLQQQKEGKQIDMAKFSSAVEKQFAFWTKMTKKMVTEGSKLPGQKELSVEQLAVFEKLMDFTKKLLTENPQMVKEMARIINEQWPSYIEDADAMREGFFAFIEKKNFDDFLEKLIPEGKGADMAFLRAEMAKHFRENVKFLEKAIPVMNAMLKSPVMGAFVEKVIVEGKKLEQELRKMKGSEEDGSPKIFVLPMKDSSVEDQAEREAQMQEDQENKNNGVNDNVEKPTDDGEKADDGKKTDDKKKKNSWILPTCLIAGVLLLAAGVVAFFMMKKN